MNYIPIEYIRQLVSIEYVPTYFNLLYCGRMYMHIYKMLNTDIGPQ